LKDVKLSRLAPFLVAPYPTVAALPASFLTCHHPEPLLASHRGKGNYYPRLPYDLGLAVALVRAFPVRSWFSLAITGG
jgi:hypothetical protein